MTTRATNQAIETFRDHGGILRTQQALGLGMHPRTLYHIRDTGIIEQVSRGVYRLAYLDATSEVPHEVQSTLPRGTKAPQLDHPPIRVFRFSGPALAVGIEVIQLDGVDVRIYDLPKTAVDCFRFRNKIGVDVAIEALNLALQQKGIQPADLLRYARQCRVETIMLPYIEAIR